MGCFITFEGIEGCGKTTQLKLLAEYLKEDGRQVTITREPGGSPIADKIRAILLDAENAGMVSLCELFLYAAARAQHVAEVVVPSLEKGDVVLCDRFTDATIAYQGYGRSLDLSIITKLNALAAGDTRPKITVLLDCPVEVGLTRAFSRINANQGAREERFELESTLFHDKVRQGYLKLAHEEPDRFLVIDGARDVSEVQADIQRAVRARLYNI